MNRPAACQGVVPGFSSRAAPTSVLTYHHDDEEDAASVPAAHPTHAPAVNLIPNGHGLSQPQELGLKLHVPRPDTSMALPGGTSQQAPLRIGTADFCGNPASSKCFLTARTARKMCTWRSLM